MKIGRFTCLAAILLRSSLALAEPLPTEIVLARRLFSEARAAESAKDWTTAIAKLTDAISMKETAGLRFHLAYCEEQQGMLVEALVDYERSGDLPIGGNEDFRAQLPGKRESLKKRIPTVTIVMPADPPNATLTVDGHPLPPTVHGKPIPLNPGRHTVVVTAPDYAAFTSVANLNEGDALVANAVLGKVLRPALVSPLTSALAAPPAPRAAESGRGGSSRPYVLVGEALLTAGALAVGIGYTLAAVSADERLDEKKTELANRFPKPSQGPVMADGACNPPSLRDAAICSELLQAAADGKDNRFVARLGFIGAGAFASAFVGTMILWPSDRSKGATARVLPIALATPGFTGLSVAGRF